MGNLTMLTTRFTAFLTAGQSVENKNYFQSQQKIIYSKQIGRRCLEHLIDVSEFVYLETLKKVHRYLHPAIKYIQYCQYLSNIRQENGEDQNFIRIHEEQLLSSAASVLQIYCMYLSSVVPANISYFHFMREKDFYIHYNALKYILEIGQIGSLFRSTNKNIDVFSRLSIDNRLTYFKLISHWLYDMVKYKCSAIYIQSNTLPYLIVMNAIILCALLNCDKINILQQHRRKQKNQNAKLNVYQHTLYALTYVLSECHMDKMNKSTQGNGCIQVILLGIAKLINLMWKEFDKSQLVFMKKKTMYAPSYWYVESIQYVQYPHLQTIIFKLILDMLAKKQNHLESYKLEKQKNIFKPASAVLEQATKNKGKQNYQMFEDEIEIQKQRSSKKQNSPSKQPKHKKKSSQQQFINEQGNEKVKQQQIQFRDHENIFNKSPRSQQMLQIPGLTKEQIFQTYQPINNLTQIISYHCLICILQYFPELSQLQKLQRTLQIQIKTLDPGSFIRPFVLGIINFIKNNINQHSHNEPQGSNTQNTLTTKQKSDIILLISLKDYSQHNTMDYSTQNYIIPYQTVGRNCSIFLNQLYVKILQNYHIQIQRSQGQIWGQVLKYNTHQFKERR